MSVIAVSGGVGSLISLIIFFFQGLARKCSFAWGETKSGWASLSFLGKKKQKSAFKIRSFLSTYFYSGLFSLTRIGLFRMWSFQGFQSIFFIPLYFSGSYWALMIQGPSGLSCLSPGPLGCPMSQPPSPALLVSSQNESRRNVHRPQQDVVATRK